MTTNPHDDTLTRMFADAATDHPSAALMARVMADAQTTATAVTGAAAQTKPPVAIRVRARKPWWRAIIGVMPGWPMLAGAIAAGVVGLTIGFYTPERIDGWSGGLILTLTGGSSMMVVPDIGALGLGDNDV